jgi:proteasome lid subunit RPN8/RPN11
VRLAREAYERLLAHARADAPVEACGYLGGSEIADRCLPLKNMDASPEHFTFDPADQFAAVRTLRAEGRRVLAVYHSHPASPARPSQEDLRLLGDPELLYAILSLAGPEPILKCFRVRDQKSAEEPLEIV